LISLAQGSLLMSMIWAASLSYMFDRRLLAAAGWMAAGSVLSFFGLIQSFTIGAGGVSSDIGFGKVLSVGLSYLAGAGFLVTCHWYAKQRKFPLANRTA
jgi:adenine/guanine/hypoxanthine permease